MKKLMILFLLLLSLTGCSKKGFFIEKKEIKRDGYKTETAYTVISNNLIDDNSYLSVGDYIIIGFRKKTHQTDLYSAYLNKNIPILDRLVVTLQFDDTRALGRSAYWITSSNGINGLVIQNAIDPDIKDSQLMEKIKLSKVVKITVFDKQRENPVEYKFDISNYNEVFDKLQKELKK